MITVGQMIGNYRVVRQLGEGGMGAVFEAVHPDIDKHVAIKVLHPHLSVDPEIAGRFFNEARGASLIDHPGIVEIYDFGRLPDGMTYIVMELLKGQTLSQRMASADGLSQAQAMRLARQIASVLVATHGKGIVHRDLKPDNVIVVPDPEAAGGERAKILDFGIAKMAEACQQQRGEHVHTRAGAVLGTPAYMSPEQCRGAQDVDARADVYSLGVMLYQMLAGRVPFFAEGLGELMAMHMFQAPPPLREARPAIRQDLETLVHAMLAKEPAQRPSMAEVEARLERLEQEPGSGPNIKRRAHAGRTEALPPPTHPWRKLALGGALLGLFLTAGAVALLRSALRRPAPGPTASAPDMATPAKAEVPAPPRPQPPPGMVFVAGGTLRMGSTEVHLPGFFLDRTEVTSGDFAAWLNRRPSAQVRGRFIRDGEVILADLHEGHGALRLEAGRFVVRDGARDKPIVQITWSGAQRYCEAQGKDLPTEAQWEFAARGPSGRLFPWGDSAPTCEGVVFGRLSGQPCSHLGTGAGDVGSAPQDRTPEGCLDLGGNVAEWVRSLSPAPDRADLPDAGTSPLRVVRGGDWGREASFCRTGSRSRTAQDQAPINVGFRCARALRSE